MTIHKNREAKFCSLIVDFDNNTLEDAYPFHVDTYKEIKHENCHICDAASASYYIVYHNVERYTNLKNFEIKHLTNQHQPFCCDALRSYKSISLGLGEPLLSFKEGKGHYPNHVFGVKRQVNNGVLISKKYYTLCHDIVKDVTSEVDESTLQKVHVFTNYICDTHDLFFGVDLYKKSLQCSNIHHMRLYPYKHVDEDILKDLLHL